MPRKREDNVFGWSALQAAAITELKPRTVQDWRKNGTFTPLLEPRDRNHRIVTKHKGLYGALDLLRLRIFSDLVNIGQGRALALRVVDDVEGFKDKKSQSVDLCTLAISQANMWVPFQPETYDWFRTSLGCGVPILFDHQGELLDELIREGFIDNDPENGWGEGLGFLYPLSDVAGQIAKAIREWIVSKSFDHSRLKPWMRTTEFEEVYDSDDWYMAFVEVDALDRSWR